MSVLELISLWTWIRQRWVTWYMKSFNFWHGHKRVRLNGGSCHRVSCQLQKAVRCRKYGGNTEWWFRFLKDKSGSKFGFLNCLPVSTYWHVFFSTTLSTLFESNIFLPCLCRLLEHTLLLLMRLPRLASLSSSQVKSSLMCLGHYPSPSCHHWTAYDRGSLFLILLPPPRCMTWPDLQSGSPFQSLSDLVGK